MRAYYFQLHNDLKSKNNDLNVMQLTIRRTVVPRRYIPYLHILCSQLPKWQTQFQCQVIIICKIYLEKFVFRESAAKFQYILIA